jgi:hypothetical protein
MSDVVEPIEGFPIDFDFEDMANGGGAVPAQQPPAQPGIMNPGMPGFDTALDVAHVSNTVANLGQLRNILALWQARVYDGNPTLAGIPQDQLSSLILRMVIHMADIGTSFKTRYSGMTFGHTAIPHIPDGTVVPMDDLVDDIKRYCTVRQFAAYYAPVYWNWAHMNDSPPAFWQKKGVTEANRFSGFDFFHGVESAASIGGAKKDLRPPVTDNERRCSQAQSRVLIYRALADQAGFQTNIVEVTNGRNMGQRASLGLLPPAPSQNP